MSFNGLLTPISAYRTDDSSYFIRNDNPVVIENLQVDNLTANDAGISMLYISSLQSVVPGIPINLGGTVLTNAGEPMQPTDVATKLYVDTHGGGGGGGVSSVSVVAPITLSGDPAINPIIGIDLSGIVRTAGAQTITGGKKFTVFPQSITGALPTDPDEFTNKLYVDTHISSIVGGVSSITDWSLYPAVQNVSMAGFNLTNCSEVASIGHSLTLTSDQDIVIQTSTGTTSITASVINLTSDLDTTIEATNGIVSLTATSGPVRLDGSEIDFTGKPLTNVGDITHNEAVSETPSVFSITSAVATNISAGLSLNLGAGGVVNIGSVGLPVVGGINMLTAGIINIGSGNYTSIENVRITNSLIEKEPGELDLQINDVASIQNDLANLVIGTNNTITIQPGGQTTINTNNNNFTVNGGNGEVSLAGQYFNMYATSSIVMEVADGFNNPIEIRAGLTNNVNITEGLYDETTDPSSVLDVKSARRGMYLPRLTSSARTAIPSPQQGLTLYDTNISSIMTYDGANWGKPAMTNVSNELLTNLSGKVSGTATRTLTGFNTVETGTVKTDVIEPVDPLVQPYVGIGADVSMPGNATLSFGLIGGGDGTISVPSGTLNVNASNIDITANINFNNSALTGVSYIDFYQPNTGLVPSAGKLDIVSDSTITTSFPGFTNTIEMKRDLTTFNTPINLTQPIQLDGVNGPLGYVLVSSGSSLPPSWLPFVGSPVGGRITLGAVSGDTIVPASNLTWDSSTGVLV